MRRIIDHTAYFWARVQRKSDSDCWPWIGYSVQGYGMSRMDGRSIYAHRHSYLLAFGWEPKGLVVMHKCDNPICCNPSHLMAGTQIDNIKDRDTKGRGNGAFKNGDRHRMAKLTWAAVQDIRAGRGHAVYCERYNVSKSTVYAVRRGDVWQSNDANARKERQFGRQAT